MADLLFCAAILALLTAGFILADLALRGDDDD